MIPKIKVHFRVTGDFNPDKFTETVGLKATDTWKVGETVQNTVIIHKCDGWELSLPENNSHDLDVELRNLISLLHTYKLQVVEFCKKCDLNAEFSCVIVTEDNDFPSIHFDNKIIDDIKSFNAEIDIDIY